jgi:hypothetical protein
VISQAEDVADTETSFFVFVDVVCLRAEVYLLEDVE